MTATFELNGKEYKTNERLLNTLRSVRPAKGQKDVSAFMGLFELALMAGTIVEVK